MHIYIYRERERGRDIYYSICVCTDPLRVVMLCSKCAHVARSLYIYIYMFFHMFT